MRCPRRLLAKTEPPPTRFWRARAGARARAKMGTDYANAMRKRCASDAHLLEPYLDHEILPPVTLSPCCFFLRRFRLLPRSVFSRSGRRREPTPWRRAWRTWATRAFAVPTSTVRCVRKDGGTVDGSPFGRGERWSRAARSPADRLSVSRAPDVLSSSRRASTWIPPPCKQRSRQFSKNTWRMPRTIRSSTER